MASSSTQDVNPKYDGSGGPEMYSGFSNTIIAIIKSKWGEAGADVWNGVYKDGTAYFTDEKVDDAKKYCIAMHSSQDDPDHDRDMPTVKYIVSLLRTYLKGIVSGSKSSGVASWHTLSQKCTVPDLQNALTELASALLVECLKLTTPIPHATIWAIDDATRNYTLGPTLKGRYGRGATEAVDDLKRRMHTLSVVKDGDNWRPYKKNDDIKTFFQGIYALRTQLQTQLPKPDFDALDAAKDGTIITTAFRQLGQPFTADYYDWRQHGNPGIKPNGDTVPDTDPKDLTSFVTRMTAAHERMQADQASSTASGVFFYDHGGAAANHQKNDTPPPCFNERNGDTCRKHQQNNCAYMHRDGRFNPSARWHRNGGKGGGRGRGNGNYKGGGNGRGKGKGKGNGKGGGNGGGKRKQGNDRMRESMEQSMRDRTANAVKATFAAMLPQASLAPANGQMGAFESFELPSGGGAQVPDIATFMSAFNDNLSPKKDGGKRQRNVYHNEIIIDISTYQNSGSDDLFDGFIGHDTCNSCNYLGNDRKNFLHLSADHDDIRAGVFYKGVGGTKNQVSLAGPYCRVINVQGKHVALIIPHAYYAPECNCRIAGSEFLSAALGWNLVQEYNQTCGTNLQSDTGCNHAMWHAGDGDSGRQLCWLSTKSSLTMIPVLPHTAANIHLPRDWPQRVQQRKLIFVPTGKERRAMQQEIHALPPVSSVVAHQGPIDPHEHNLQPKGDVHYVEGENPTSSHKCYGCGGGYAQPCNHTQDVVFLTNAREDFGDTPLTDTCLENLECSELPFSIDDVEDEVTFQFQDPGNSRSTFVDRNGKTSTVLHNLTSLQHDIAFSVADLTKKQAANLWQRRLGYPPTKVQQQLSEDHASVVYDDSLTTSSDPIAAKARSRTKAYKRKDGVKPEDVTANGATCATDHFSGIKFKGIYGATGWFGFTCFKSLFTWVFCCRSRDDYPVILLKMIQNLSAQGLRLRKVVSDSAPEIIRGQVTQLAAEHEFQISQSSVNGGNSGGLQEVHGGIVARKARTLVLLAKHLPKSTWPCAVYYACRLVNLMPMDKFGGKSRFELWYGRKPDLSAMCIKTYGCPVEYGIPKLKRIQAGGRWRELTRSGSFVGLSGTLVMVYDHSDNNIVQVSKQKVFFLEGAYTHDLPPDDPREDPAAKKEITNDSGHDDEAPTVTRSEINLRTPTLDDVTSTIFDDLETSAGPIFEKDGDVSSKLSSLETPVSNEPPVLPTGQSTAQVPLDDQPTQHAPQQKPRAPPARTNAGSKRKQAPRAEPRRSTRVRSAAMDDATKIANFTSFLLLTVLAAATATLEHDIDAYKQLPTPKNFADALLAPDWKGWVGAYRSELTSWLKNGVFVKVNKSKLPPKTKVFFIMDVLKRKWRADNGLLDKLKVRAVLSGNLFVRGVHCATNTFAPCVSALSVRLFLAICAATFTVPSSLDVETAFLHGIETHEVYAHYPTYFRMAEASIEDLEKIRKRLLSATGKRLSELRKMLNSKINPRESFVMRMIKSGYGSPSASKAYYAKWVSVMTIIGMTTSVVDACVYYRFWPETGDWLIALCWCDDVPFTGSSNAKKWFVQQVKKHLPITFNETMTTFLGFEIKYHDNGTVSMHCGELLANIAKRFDEYLPEHNKTMPSPAGYVPKPATPDEHQKAKHLPFAAIIGCLQYVCGWVRFDGLTVLSMLSQHTCNRWSLDHFYAAIHLLSYLIETKDLGNYWTTSDSIHGKLQPYAFSDADLASDPSRRSRSAIVIMIDGGPLYCKSFLQTVIQLSTCCSEIIAAAQTSIDLKGVRNLLGELGFKPKGPTKQYCDNQAAVSVMNGEASLSQSTKHIEMRFLLVRQLIASGIVLLAYVKTSNNVSDILSKNLGRVLFIKFRDAMLGLNAHLHGAIFKQ